MTPRRRPSPCRGFTLIELLTAVAVLGIIALLIAGIVRATTRTTRASTRLVDAAMQARLTFDRLGLDLAALVRRPDVDFEASGPGSPAASLLLFVTGVGAAGGGAQDRRSSVVSYQVAASALNKGPDGQPRLCLQRAAKPIRTTDAGFLGLKASGLPLLFGDGAFPSALLPQAADYDILAQGVVRMAVGYQLLPDNRPVTLLDGTALARAQGQIVYSPPARTPSATDGSGATQTMADTERIAAVVVGLVTLDAPSLQPLRQGDVAALAGAFPLPSDPGDENKLPAQLWAPLAASASALPSGVPLPARQAVRVFQRVFPVHPYGGGS